MGKAKVEIPPNLLPVFHPDRGNIRYRASHGGRGSGKSFSFALMAAVFGYVEPIRILCTREFQVSIKESFHAELKAAIYSYSWLADSYDVGKDYLRGKNGTEFIFRGLRRNMQSIKSMSQVDLCIIEEAEDVPEQSWRDLIPTVRADKSEIWCIWNPRNEGSPVDQRLIKQIRRDAVVAEINFKDNPWFPDVLEAERQHDLETMDFGTYNHVWNGAYLENSETQILHGKIRIAEFEPLEDQHGNVLWDGPYHGLDFGFANDPTTANRCWIHDNILYVEYEANKINLELDETADYMKDHIPGIEKYVIRADSARPESISYLKRKGLPRIIGVEKWPGSVEDGIQHLRSYKEIVVHPRCKETIRETRLYSYKVDKQTGDVLPVVVDAHNHHIDDIRYSLAPIIKHKGQFTTNKIRGLV